MNSESALTSNLNRTLTCLFLYPRTWKTTLIKSSYYRWLDAGREPEGLIKVKFSLLMRIIWVTLVNRGWKALYRPNSRMRHWLSKSSLKSKRDLNQSNNFSEKFNLIGNWLSTISSIQLRIRYVRWSWKNTIRLLNNNNNKMNENVVWMV